jgi:hypothetical protein
MGGHPRGSRHARVLLAVAVLLTAAAPGAAGEGWWVERYGFETPRRLWVGIGPAGDAEALAFDADRVTEVRSGRLDAARAEALAAAARSALEAPAPALPPGRIPEGDIVRLGGTLAGRRVARSFRPALPEAAEARALAEATEAAVAALPHVPRGGRWVRAEAVDADRAAMLRRDGRLPFRTRAAAARVPSVDRALADPGRFVAVPEGEEPALGKLAGEARQLFVADGDTFEVTVLAATGR